MRRGHAGIGGWRNENSRHFMPRSGGPPHFRHSARNFHLLDTPRFPPPGPRPPRPSVPFTNHPNQIGNRPDHHDRNKYRQDNRQSTQYRPPDRSHHQSQRSMFPFLDSHNNFYANSPRESSHINRLGDIDHRQQGNKQNSSDHYGRPPISPWAIPPENQRAFYDERNKYNKQHNKYHDNVESSKMPVLDYPGHRPPASDHYGGNPSSSIDNSHSFSRSVDDTVDIVRKRLQNRSEPQPLSEHIDHHDEDLRIPNSNSGNFNNIVQEQPKKRMQRQKLDKNVESNCDKMKSKIVQQLFKMDKDRIHKLMDNPSSSTKFEYAISSLITESQNSLNKHLRSVAEKSLSSSEDFINNDNNTIYEDTFMKQMQHILEPQDTVLLEDIKPLVLAELSKVLQLNEYDHPFQVVDGQQNYHQIPDQHGSYGSMEPHNYEDYSNSQNAYYDSVETPPVGYEDYGNSTTDLSHLDYDPPEPEKPVVLYERRNTRKNSDYRPEPTRPEPTFSPVKELSTEQPNNNVCLTREDFPPFPHDNRSTRQSIDRRQSEDKSKEPEIQAPLFDANCTQISEDDDPFAELDNQYHVAVDPNFLDMDTFGMSSPQLSRHSSRSSSNNRELSNSARTPNKDTVNIKQEFDNQNSQHSISSSRLKLTSSLSMNQNSTTENTTNCNTPVKKEVFTPTKDNTNFEIQSNIDIQPECNTDSNIKKQLESSLNVNTSPKPMVPSSSRKRSIDQKPAHRKEKRKKSETSPSDSSHKAKNKDTPTTPVVDDCATKDREKYTESAKSIFKMFFSKNENSKEVHKDTKKADSADKSYSDKYVKRKETHKKTKEDDQKKRQRSLSTSHSTVSPKDSTNNNNTQSSKTKLQSIDMFLEQPKKITNKHQPHRNTAKAPNTPTKTVEVTKPKPLIPFNRKITKRHVSTQVVYNKTIEKETQTIENKNCTSRLCKLDKKKTLVKGVQTDPVSFTKPPSKATDAFERMKEIDMEIQVLLQEKFKLYSSLESNSACPSTIQTLGMTVLNVPLNEVTETDEHNSENSLSGDAIVDDFTNIPVEELEQIALESVEDPETPVVEKKTRRHKISEESRASSASPTVKRSARKALKTPNISLLEQIITDDRPLEDIISLDDLETTPVKSKKKAKQPKKKGNKKAALKINKTPLTTVNEYGLKECYVVLQRDDLSRYFKTRFDDAEQNSIITVESYSPSPVMENPVEIIEKSHETVFNVSDIVEETVVENDVQFDMLDVSEDIVIGEMCEMKSEDKEVERTESVTEDIILDNSQSAVEPARSEGVQSENICKMYDYSTDESLRRDAVTVSGHADAVLAIECVENNFVAACLDGNVYHFNGDGQLLSTLRGSNLAVTCLTIVKEKYGTTVYTGSLDSRIRYYDLETGLEKGPECNVLSPIQTMDRAWDTIFVGTRTGFVLQFECKNNMLIPVSTVKFSDQSILALRAMKEGPRKVLLVAARSEDVTIKDAQTGLLLRSLQGPKMTVYTLLYEDGKVYCGTSSHLVHVFDYASGSHVGAHEGGKGAVCLRGAGGLVFAGCYDGCVYVFRDGEPRALAQLRGPSLMLLSLAVQGTKIIAGYKDRSLYIWKIPLSILQEMIL